MTIRIKTLGQFQVERDGRRVQLASGDTAARALLVYMCIERSAWRDDVLATFWPYQPHAVAQAELDRLLGVLEDALPGWLPAEGPELRVSDACVTDVAEFIDAVERGEMERARALYAGPFLADAELGAGPGLARWIDDQRTRLERLHDQATGYRYQPSKATPARVAEPHPAYATGPASEPEAPATASRRRETPGATFVRLLTELRDRKLVRWTLAYLAGALVVIEATSNLGEAFDWPGAVLRTVTLLLGFGAILVLGYAWLHGQEGERRLGWMHVVLAAAAILFVGAGAVAIRPSGEIPTAIAAAPALDERRIAVLFFEDYSIDQSLGPLAAGFTEALITELGRVDGITVLSRAAMAPYRGRHVPLDTLVADLQAGTLVGGSITHVGDAIRVTFELIDGATKLSLYGDTLRQPATEVTALAADLPRQVARVLRSRLGTELSLRETKRATESAQAWTLVQRAGALMEDEGELWRDDLAGGLRLLDRADSLLARAERIDPAWPEPPARRGQLAALRARRVAGPAGTFAPEAVEEAFLHFERALSRDPAYVPALEARGLLALELAERQSAGDAERLYGAAERDLQRAVDLDRHRASSWWGLSRLYYRQRSYAESQRAAVRALEMDAFLEHDQNTRFQLFHTAFALEEHAEAARRCREVKEHHPRAQAWAYCELWMLGSSPAIPPDVDRAWILADTVVHLGPRASADIYQGWSAIHVAKTLARAGQADSARAVIGRTFPDEVPGWATYDLAHTLVALGDEDDALVLLRRFAADYPQRVPSLATDWFLRPLHGRSEFARLIGSPGPG